MIVMRCAWHPQYRGYPWVYRVASWRDPGRLQFSDGMCRSCGRRWHADFWAGRAAIGAAPPPAPAMIPTWMPRVGVAMALSAAVILAARPLDTDLLRPLADTRPASQARPVHVATGPIEAAASPQPEPPCMSPTPARSHTKVVRVAAVHRAPVVRAAVAQRAPVACRVFASGPACIRFAALHTATPAAGERRAVVARVDPAPALLLTQAP